MSTAVDQKTEKPSAASLLQAASKKASAPPRKASGYIFDGDSSLGAAVLGSIRVAAEADRELGASKDRLRDVLDAWYVQQVRTQGYQATVRIFCGARSDETVDTLRITFQHRYSKIPIDRANAIRDVVGDEKFNIFFKQISTFEAKKEVAEDPDKLNEVVEAMINGTVAAHFAEWFDVCHWLYPTKLFTERRWIDLDDEQNAQLGRHGIRGVVAFSDATKD